MTSKLVLAEMKNTIKIVLIFTTNSINYGTFHLPYSNMYSFNYGKS